jgi:hypothetical protein
MKADNLDQSDVPISTLWRHRKSGGVYTISGFCQIEATNELGVLYSSVQTEGPLWCRPFAEFTDGRFVRLNAS